MSSIWNFVMKIKKKNQAYEELLVPWSTIDLWRTIILNLLFFYSNTLSNVIHIKLNRSSLMLCA